VIRVYGLFFCAPPRAGRPVALRAPTSSSKTFMSSVRCLLPPFSLTSHPSRANDSSPSRIRRSRISSISARPIVAGGDWRIVSWTASDAMCNVCWIEC
jgi:hypothetical protein